MARLIDVIRWVKPSRIGPRLLVFHLLLVFLPVAGILYLEVYESQLLDAQERSMVQQGRLVAAALGERDELTAEAATGLLRRLGQRGDARIRIYDANATLLADSVRIPELHAAERAGAESASEYDRERDTLRGIRQRFLYRVGAWLVSVRRALRSALTVNSKVANPSSSDGNPVAAPAPEPEIVAALAGRYGSAVRATPGQRSLTLTSAVPIRAGERIIGAAVVSQTTFRILQALYRVRLRIFEIVVASFVVAAVLGFVVSATIVRPVVRLRRAAVAAAERRGTPGSFGRVKRRDEIGDLARALEELTTRLESHIRLLESFAADVSHEFKNPLASIRTAAEMIADSELAADRERLLMMLTKDVDRLERLVSGVRELARIDAQLAHDALVPVDVSVLLRQIADGFVAQGRRVQVSGPASLSVRATPDRLAQVFENLLQNAFSFAPADSPVEIVVAAAADRTCVVTVADRGPGIPAAHLERVFERFFTYRPGSDSRRDHTGLGLAIARAIVEGHGGSISVSNREGGGATFEVRLPVGQRFSGFAHGELTSGFV
jgi:two-component system, OmpR family, sensor histidine kinase ChvG